jgi:hypothetical protein
LTHATYGPLFTKSAPTIIEKGYKPRFNQKGNKNAQKKAPAEEATTTSPIQSEENEAETASAETTQSVQPSPPTPVIK